MVNVLQSFGDLNFLWWNVQNFAHFDIAQTTRDRWPKSEQEYLEKRRRVEAVLRRLRDTAQLHLLAFAEITEQAVTDLRDQLFPGYKVFSLAGLLRQTDFSIALIYHPSVGFEDEDFLKASNVPGSTRPMAIIHLRFGKHLIRFYICHWTARFAESSEKWRVNTAQQLSEACYDFLTSGDTESEARHLVILGDLNEEPYGVLEKWLYASRDRAASMRPEHYSDKDVKRVRLYNSAWRLLGEQIAHPHSTIGGGVAGSYYWRAEKTWHTFDQVIVSGSLLSDEPPYFDEEYLQIKSLDKSVPSELLASDKLPHRFEWKDGVGTGLSDHLPLCGRIVLA